MATGLQSWKIAKGLYIIPLLFAYTPILGGHPVDILLIFFFAFLGLYAFTCAIQGHMENTVTWPERIILLLLAFFLIKPTLVMIHFLAASGLIVYFYFNLRKKGRRQTELPA
jgi:TRAP-type uncharacterized transport system fused permease subunit